MGGGYGKKTPLRSSPMKANTGCDVDAGSDVKLKPG
jgi:hypothetical protein